MARRLLALLAVAVLAAAACGDSSDEPEPATQETENDAPAGDDAGALEIKALDFDFEPSELSVEPGADVSIDFVNGGSVAHTFTADDANVDVTADAGGTGLVGFQAPDEDATIEFVCRFHPDQMQGTITVGSGGSGAGGGGGGGSEDESDDLDY